MLEKSKKTRVIIASVLLLLALFLDFTREVGSLTIVLLLLSWFIAGIDIIYQAYLNLTNRMLMAEHFLMSIATIGAIAIGEYREAALVMVLFQIGELLEDAAIDRSRESVAELMDIAAPVAYKIVDGQSFEVDPDEIEIGDLLEVRAGERVPVDGVIVEGRSYLDTSALTGESMPVAVNISDDIFSGSINGDGRLIMRASKSAYDSTAMRIIDLLEEATENQAETETTIHKFAKIYTPIVVFSAILLALIPPLFFQGQIFSEWFRRALIFLVVSCPCAFVVSVPMSFVLGLGASSRLGILVKGGHVFEKVGKINILATDKTGTLTQGDFKVIHAHTSDGVSQDSMLAVAHELEKASNHPIAMAIRRYAQEQDQLKSVEFGHIENVPGMGLRGENGNQEFVVGNLRYMEEHNLIDQASADGCAKSEKALVHVAQIKAERKYLGHYVIEDVVKENAAQVVADLHKYVDEVVMLTGDKAEVAAAVAKEVGIDEYQAELLPQDKLNWVKNASSQTNRKIAFVGDGLNDAPVMAASDLGIAMGGIGSDATIEAADVVLVHDNLDSIPRLFAVAKDTLKIAYQNIWLSLAIKFIFLVLSAFGLTAMWMAVFADVGVTLLAIANAFRLYFLPNKLKTRY